MQVAVLVEQVVEQRVGVGLGASDARAHVDDEAGRLRKLARVRVDELAQLTVVELCHGEHDGAVVSRCQRAGAGRARQGRESAQTQISHAAVSATHAAVRRLGEHGGPRLARRVVAAGRIAQHALQVRVEAAVVDRRECITRMDASVLARACHKERVFVAPHIEATGLGCVAAVGPSEKA